MGSQIRVNNSKALRAVQYRINLKNTMMTGGDYQRRETLIKDIKRFRKDLDKHRSNFVTPDFLHGNYHHFIHRCPASGCERCPFWESTKQIILGDKHYPHHCYLGFMCPSEFSPDPNLINIRLIKERVDLFLSKAKEYMSRHSKT